MRMAPLSLRRKNFLMMINTLTRSINQKVCDVWEVEIPVCRFSTLTHVYQ